MGKLERQLGEGEQIVLHLHPHWRRLVLPMAAIPLDLMAEQVIPAVEKF